MQHTVTTDPSLLEAFRAAVLRQIRKELAEEELQAETLKRQVLPHLRSAVGQARAAGECGRAWLFGSFAWSKPTGASDVDLLVDACPEPFRLAGELARVCGRDVHVVPLESAPTSLRERALAEGIEL